MRVELFGSLGATVTDMAPSRPWSLACRATSRTPSIQPWRTLRYRKSTTQNRLRLAWGTTIPFSIETTSFCTAESGWSSTVTYANAAFDAEGSELGHRTYFSIGGGFVITEEEARVGQNAVLNPTHCLSFHDGCAALGARPPDRPLFQLVMVQNEFVRHEEGRAGAGLLHIWSVMKDCIDRGCRTPPGTRFPRVQETGAAPQTGVRSRTGEANPFDAMERVTVFALAVNEENAAGGRGATPCDETRPACIIRPVLSYYERYVPEKGRSVRFPPHRGCDRDNSNRGASISRVPSLVARARPIRLFDGGRRARQADGRHPRPG